MSERIVAWDRYLRLLSPLGLGALTIALALGAFTGMNALDWALVTLASFMLFVQAIIRYRDGE